MVIVGTRPETIKMAPIIRAVEKDPELELIFVHSGQHYDYELSQQFLKELELPPPRIDLHVGSGTHAEQTSKMLLEYERIFKEHKPDLILVEGDTNTVVAAGLAAIKLRIPLGHVEAGLRSYDRTMPEEINRQVVRVCAELHFAPTERAAINLLHEGIPPYKIFVTGNPIVDACLQHLKIADRKSKILKHLKLNSDCHLVTVTIHRPENVDDSKNLKQIVRILLSLKDCKVVFPVHPRTRKKLEDFQLMERLRTAENIVLSEPLGYFDFLKLLSKSALILTDSGGIQEEALILKVPCLTLRYNTERPETVEMGANRLVGLDQKLVLSYADKILHNLGFDNRIWDIRNPYGDGNAGERIVQIIRSACLNGLKVPSSSFLKAGSASYKMKTVNDKLNGKTIREISEVDNVSVMLVYDEDGKPRFPNPEMIVREGWVLVMFGEFLLKKLRSYSFTRTYPFRRSSSWQKRN